MKNPDTNAAQKARMDEREKELQAELKALQEQRKTLNAGDSGHTPTQPGSASRTGTGEPGKYDNPGHTGYQGQQPKPSAQPQAQQPARVAHPDQARNQAEPGKQ